MSSTVAQILSLPGAFLTHWYASWNSSSTTKPTTAGAAIYSPLFLNAVYDRLVLGFYCTHVWRCPSYVIQALCSTLVSQAATKTPRILDIGVGTGYFLANIPSSFILPGTTFTLVDLNPACLETASARCRTSHGDEVKVNTVRGDFLAPPDDAASVHSLLKDDGRFDVVLTNMLLHCVPGPPARKAAALAGLAAKVERVDGVLAGVTILGDGVQHNLLGRFIMFWHNALGMFDNQADGAKVFVEALQNTFESVVWRVEGTVLIFEARRPKA
ncbi:hypothetical protein N0V82_002390 [Gnomoniopsis sp. IMI 355080]|nr:hypothetical protein N0V82_002390 [Gnomoniopsis sp. IMI 355080]